MIILASSDIELHPTVFGNDLAFLIEMMQTIENHN